MVSFSVPLDVLSALPEARDEAEAALASCFCSSGSHGQWGTVAQTSLLGRVVRQNAAWLDECGGAQHVRGGGGGDDDALLLLSAEAAGALFGRIMTVHAALFALVDL